MLGESSWRASFRATIQNTVSSTALRGRKTLANQRVACPDGSYVFVSGKFHGNEHPANVFKNDNSKWYSMPADDGKTRLKMNDDLAGTLHTAPTNASR